MPIYLFRDEHVSNAFAYTMDVMGRNLPGKSPDRKWMFVSTVSDQEMPEREEVVSHLRSRGFYVFES
jgi:hypothetical protein